MCCSSGNEKKERKKKSEYTKKELLLLLIYFVEILKSARKKKNRQLYHWEAFSNHHGGGRYCECQNYVTSIVLLLTKPTIRRSPIVSPHYSILGGVLGNKLSLSMWSIQSVSIYMCRIFFARFKILALYVCVVKCRTLLSNDELLKGRRYRNWLKYQRVKSKNEIVLQFSLFFS